MGDCMGMSSFTAHRGRDPSTLNLSLQQTPQTNQNTPVDLILLGNKKLEKTSSPPSYNSPKSHQPTSITMLKYQEGSKFNTYIMLLKGSKGFVHYPLFKSHCYFYFSVRKAAEIRGEGNQGTVSLPADGDHVICRTASSQTPATKPADSPKYSNLSLCRPTAQLNTKIKRFASAGSVPLCYLIKIYPNHVFHSYLRNAFQTLCICFQLLPQNTIEAAYCSYVSLLSKLNILSLVSISPQVLTLTTQRLYILQYYIFYSQKAQFKAIIFMFKGPCASC